MVSNKCNINVFIIGLRGYTKNYGGWETFAHGLLNNWQDENIHFFAFEKANSVDDEEILEVNNVTCIRVFEPRTGSSAMMFYDKKCTDVSLEYIQKKSVKNPILFYLGLRIGPYCFLKKKQFKKLGIKVMENPAGAEWRRTKWNKLVQAYAFISAILMAKSVDCLVCDNEGIRALYNKLLIGKKPNMEYVAYGVDEVPRVNDSVPQKIKEYFDEWNIEKNNYYLILGRYIPENNYEMMIKGFMKSNSSKKLLIITNYKTEIQKFHKHIIKSTNYPEDDRVIMAGTLYNKEILHYVRQYAAGYIHGHSVGGTNPGLLEAMAETNVNMLYDVDFNRYVGEGTALYFKNENELCNLIEFVDSLSLNNAEKFGERARKRMKECYSWQHIVDEYRRIIKALVE